MPTTSGPPASDANALDILVPSVLAAAGWCQHKGTAPQFRPHDPAPGTRERVRRVFSGTTARRVRRQLTVVNAYAAAVMRDSPALGEVLAACAVRGLYGGAGNRGGLFVPLDPTCPPVAEAIRRMVGAGCIEPAGEVEVVPGTDGEAVYERGRAYPAWKVADHAANERFVADLEERLKAIEPTLAGLA